MTETKRVQDARSNTCHLAEAAWLRTLNHATYRNGNTRPYSDARYLRTGHPSASHEGTWGIAPDERRQRHLKKLKSAVGGIERRARHDVSRSLPLRWTQTAEHCHQSWLIPPFLVPIGTHMQGCPSVRVTIEVTLGHEMFIRGSLLCTVLLRAFETQSKHSGGLPS